VKGREKPASLLRILRVRVREEAARNGWQRAGRNLWADGCEFLRESLPGRKRLRYGDIEYDWDYRVDTTAATVKWKTRLAGALSGVGYQPCDPGLFHRTIGKLPVAYGDFVLIDLGSGKGRALLLAADYPFKRIVGIELMPELDEIARANVSRYQSLSQRCFAIETVCGDARDWQFPWEPIVVFLFNPLPEAALEVVVENLAGSLRAKPRPAWIVYHNPVLEHLLHRPAFQRVEGDPQYAIYRNQSEPS